MDIPTLRHGKQNVVVQRGDGDTVGSEQPHVRRAIPFPACISTHSANIQHSPRPCRKDGIPKITKWDFESGLSGRADAPGLERPIKHKSPPRRVHPAGLSPLWMHGAAKYHNHTRDFFAKGPIKYIPHFLSFSRAKMKSMEHWIQQLWSPCGRLSLYKLGDIYRFDSSIQALLSISYSDSQVVGYQN